MRLSPLRRQLRKRGDVGKVKTELTTISPSQASDLLRGNKNNRRVSAPLVTRYARDMAAGNWQSNGSAIVMNGDGSLLDGQHRLMACIEAGVAFKTLVIRGISSDAMATIDTGRSRSLSDVLAMRGEKNTRTLASVLRQAMIWGNTVPPAIPFRNARANPSPSELLELLQRYPEARDATLIANKPHPRGMTGGIVGALALNLIVHIDDRAYVDSFFNAVMQGEGDTSSAPYALWHALVKRAGEVNNKPDTSWYLALLVKAWNAQVTGDTPALWRWRRAGSNAEQFPVLLDLDGEPINLIK